MTNFPRENGILKRLERLEKVRGFRPSGPLPGIRLGKTNAQSITTGSTQVVEFNVVQDVSGDMVMSNGVVTVPRTGWYQVSGNVTFASSVSSARRLLFVLANGAALAGDSKASAQSPAAISILSVSTGLYLEAGETAALGVNVATAWSLDVTNTYMTALSVIYQGV